MILLLHFSSISFDSCICPQSSFNKFRTSLKLFTIISKVLFTCNRFAAVLNNYLTSQHANYVELCETGNDGSMFPTGFNNLAACPLPQKTSQLTIWFYLADLYDPTLWSPSLQVKVSHRHCPCDRKRAATVAVIWSLKIELPVCSTQKCRA